jgi:[ribosomal protein S5]-alanine N-acetyltransferase
MKSDPGNDHWYSYFAIIREGKLIGMIGSKGKPDENNSIEVGYGISEKYFNNGFTTEALGYFQLSFSGSIR